MDPVTHVVLGYCCSVRATPNATRGRALAVALGALSPDIDLLMMPTGWDRYLAAHEIGTHSALGAVICGVLAAGVARMIRRPARLRPLLLPAAIAALSHVAADLLAGASIRVLWPLADARVSNLGVVAMADPIVVLAALLVGAFLIGGKSARPTLAIGVLGLVVALVAWQTLRRERAEGAYRSHPAAHEAVGAYRIEPVWGAINEWRMLDRTSHSVRAWRVDAAGHMERQLEIPAATGDAQLIAASTRWDTVRNFQRAHDLAFAIATPRAVEWSDVRYCWEIAAQIPQCGVWAGGEFSTPPTLARLIVRVGDLLQTR
jgi:membrane-bound metal-dependent hydrolase YbcI (DUF457 family)